MASKPALLFLIDDLSPATTSGLQRQLSVAYDVHAVAPAEGWSARLEPQASQARAILIKGGINAVSAEDIARLPNLALICCPGAGYERVDVAAATAREIAITNGSGANSACVAEHAMGMVLAVVRRFRAADAAARAGRWQQGIGSPPQVAGKTLGIVGLGRIGVELAHRALAFRMEILYHNRRVRADVRWEHVPDLKELARRADVLVCILPGGDHSRGVIDAAVLEALGPRGYFINVGRGSSVDTAALTQALKHQTIAGAGLDVLDTEPRLPPELLEVPELLITPHIAGRSPEATTATLQLAVDNLLAFSRGTALENQVNVIGHDPRESGLLI